MLDALVRSNHSIVTADAFGALPSGERNSLRAELVCPSCAADAYYVREARNGRRACFGARPHLEACELASLATEHGGSAALDETDERINAGDVFRLEPNRTRAIRHVTHDSGDADGNGNAMRTSSMTMDRLLWQLALRPSFRDSRTMLVLRDDTRGSVRTVCQNVADTSERDVGKRNRIYWGTILYPRPDDRGGAWLNTGSRSTLTLHVGAETLEAILDSKGIDDIEDLSGSLFAYLGPLRRAQSGKLLVFADDIEWLAVRAFDEDAELN